MDERPTGDGQSPRLAVLRALPTPVDVELYVSDAPPLLEVIDDLPEPRIADLDALLREVDGLRSSIRRDLSLAATAADAGAEDLAGWLLIQEDGAIRSFEQRALAHLHELEARDAFDEHVALPVAVPAKRFRRMMPAAPLVAACAAVFGFLTIPAAPAPTSSPITSNVALESYAELTRLATGGASHSRITAAANQFHADLAPLVAAAGSDPAAAEKAIALLQSERAVLAAGPDSPALQAVLRQADALVAKLRASLPRRTVRVPVPVPQPPQEEQRRESSQPKASTSPKPSASPSASPKPSSSPKSTTSAKPSPSPSESNPLPTSPLDR